jgi:hypothetical protein
MSTYILAKAHQEQILRQAKQDHLIRAAKRAERKVGEQRPSQARTWNARRLPATRA